VVDISVRARGDVVATQLYLSSHKKQTTEDIRTEPAVETSFVLQIIQGE